MHLRLLIIGLVTDGDAITPEAIQEVGEVKLLANGLVTGSHALVDIGRASSCESDPAVLECAIETY